MIAFTPSSPLLIVGSLGSVCMTGVGGGTAPAWTPADIANLAIFFWFKEGNCLQGPPPNDDVTLDNPIHYVSPLFGTSIYATSDGNPPTLRADGMELDAGGINLLNFSSPFSSNIVTVYWSFIAAAGATQCFAQHSTENALVGGFSEIAIYDNGGNAANAGIDNPGTVVMGRFNIDGAFGNYRLDGTDQYPLEGSGGYSGYSFNQLGGVGGLGANNDSTDNRYRLLIVVNRFITFDSAEDILIRNWISANDGAAL